MAPPLKSILYNLLKTARDFGADINFEKPYVSYTAEELADLVALHGLQDQLPPELQPEIVAQPAAPEPQVPRSAPIPEPQPLGLDTPRMVQRPPVVAQPAVVMKPTPDQWGKIAPQTLARLLDIPYSDRAETRAGLTFNTHGPNDPIRVDSTGKVWFQDEVPKPAIPKPRARRIIKYRDPGVKEIKRYTEDGHLDESFEVAGDEARDMEIRVTLPSWQVGIYKDPRMPFKVHVYNGQRAFDWADIVMHYGGMDLVPSSCKRTYIGGDLCYDIKTTRETIEKQFRDLQLGRMIED